MHSLGEEPPHSPSVAALPGVKHLWGGPGSSKRVSPEFQIWSSNILEKAATSATYCTLKIFTYNFDKSVANHFSWPMGENLWQAAHPSLLHDGFGSLPGTPLSATPHTSSKTRALFWSEAASYFTNRPQSLKAFFFKVILLKFQLSYTEEGLDSKNLIHKDTKILLIISQLIITSLLS